MQKNLVVKIGDFFFKYRNYLFPLFLVLLFVLKKPAYQYSGSHLVEEVKDYVAFLVVIAGLVIRALVIGFAYIKRGGLNKKVYADKLVVQGFFGVCRNPLYLGNILIYLGVLLMHGTPVVLLLGGSFFLFVYFTIVRSEEFFLRNKFGTDFENYCKQVPRWIPKLSNLKKSIEGMEFNFKRVLIKDYTTIVNAAFAITGLELYERYSFYESFSYTPFQVIFIILVLFVSVIAIAKKSKILVAS